ncbi:MAG: DJ-1/PfpI family protein [Cyclobacteriaceae bacterium]
MPINATDISTILFLAPPRVHLLDLGGPAHIFYEAVEYGAPFTSHFITLGPSNLSSSSGLQFAALEAYADFELAAHDLIFIPGLAADLLLDPDFLTSLQPFSVWLRRQQANGAWICSVCTGAFLLAEAGLLDQRECTTHWKFAERFQQRYPQALFQKNRLFVDAGTVFSSAGVASGIDLALYLVEKKMGSRFASRLAREVVVYLRRAESDPQLSIFLQYRNHIDDTVHQVQDLLAQSLSQKPSIETLAEAVHVSPRTLTRVFKKATHITIGEYTDKLRVERAVKLLGDGHKVVTAAAECGLSSANQLRSLLRKYRGILPHEVIEMA